MNAKKYSFIIFVISILGLALFVSSCDKSANAPQDRQTSVRFVFENDQGEPGESLFFNKSNPRGKELNSGSPANLTRNHNSFQKLNEIGEAKVMLLDMTQWETEEDFFEAWYNSGQYELIDTSLWNDNQDYWDNIKSAVNSYTGEYFQTGGEYDLNIQSGVAKGTVTAKPGLNYFFICLRENQRTVYYDEFSWMIVEGEENTIRVQASSALFIEIYSPQEADSFVVGQEVFFNGFAEDRLNGEFIPDENYVWESDRDGQLGRGPYQINSTLSPNNHRITLRVTTPDGTVGSKQVNIVVYEE